MQPPWTLGGGPMHSPLARNTPVKLLGAIKYSDLMRADCMTKSEPDPTARCFAMIEVQQRRLPLPIRSATQGASISLTSCFAFKDGYFELRPEIAPVIILLLKDADEDDGGALFPQAFKNKASHSMKTFVGFATSTTEPFKKILRPSRR